MKESEQATTAFSGPRTVESISLKSLIQPYGFTSKGGFKCNPIATVGSFSDLLTVAAIKGC
jgi:hypothetical protein